MNNFFGFGAISTDVYKLGHADMYQKGTDMVYGNLTPRSNRLFKAPAGYDGKMVVVGTTAGIQEIHANWQRFFNMEKEAALEIYMEYVEAALGVGTVSRDRMAALHNLGYLPVRVKSLPEGSRVKMKTPVLTIKNTHKDFSWVVNFLETAISQITWPTMTTATIAAEYRRILTKWAKITGTPLEAIDWQAHDFSARGLMGPEAAARVGVGHLSSFYGSDTVQAAHYIKQTYDTSSVGLLFGSVPATEHAVSSSNILFIERMLKRGDLPVDEAVLDVLHRGEVAGLNTRELAELLFLHHYITVLFPTGIVSYVSDTYDYWAVLTRILPVLKPEIMARDGKLVVRPDSGDPLLIVAGMKEGFEFRRSGRTGVAYKLSDWKGAALVQEIAKLTPIPEHEVDGSIDTLYKIFGGTITETGHKQLDSHIGLIYGDSITLERANNILAALEDKGYASGNIVFGVGSFTYQYITRDTFGFAVKATATSVDEEFIEIFKDPATGDKLKKSAKGYMLVAEGRDGDYEMVDCVSEYEEGFGALEEIYRDGVLIAKANFATIRERVKAGL